jgi:hypothetical protein
MRSPRSEAAGAGCEVAWQMPPTQLSDWHCSGAVQAAPFGRRVAVAVALAVAVDVAVGVLVAVAVSVAVPVWLAVDVLVAVAVAVGVSVAVPVAVAVAVPVAVEVLVAVAVAVGVSVGVAVGVLVGVWVGVWVGGWHMSARPTSDSSQPAAHSSHCESSALVQVRSEMQPSIGVHAGHVDAGPLLSR